MGGMFVGLGKEEERRRKKGGKKEVSADNNYMKKNVVCAQKDPSSYLYQRYTYLFPIPPRVYIINS